MDIYTLVRRAVGVSAAFGFTLALGLCASAQVAITINGNAVNVSPEPMIQAGRVFVPLRGVFESLGATVVYDNGQINATGNGREISLQIGSNQATVNGAAQMIDVAPFIVGASTYVPLRFVSQALGATVSWDNTDRVVSITMDGAPQTSNAAPPPPASYDDTQAYEENDDFINQPPPPIPVYEQPPVPAPNDIWMPGYWAWGGAGYYWVPGTWVQAPQPQYVWTPGYWGFHNGYFGWHPGYWATEVGFYGGVNYGAGYYGHGYGGGRWFGNTYRYNTAITHVTNITIIKNVYIDRTVVIVNPANKRIGYNGGPHGIVAQPTSTELIVARSKHVGITPLQVQHIRIASQDRGLLATVNAGKPPITVAPRPFTPAVRPIGFTPIVAHDRVLAQKMIVRPALARPSSPPMPTRPVLSKPAVPTAAPFHPIGGRTMLPRPVRTEGGEPTLGTPKPRPPQFERPIVTPRPLETPEYVRPTPRPVFPTPERVPGEPGVVHPPIVHPEVGVPRPVPPPTLRPNIVRPPTEYRPTVMHPTTVRPPTPRPPHPARPPHVPKPRITEPPH